MNLKVMGLRVEKYIRSTCEGHNCDFEYGQVVDDKHTILCESKWKEKYEIELTYEEGECGSGWCVASWANINIKPVKNFRGYTHNIREEVWIDINDNIFNDELSYYESENSFIDNKVFNYSYCGGDAYYPNGWYDVNMELFKENGRYKEKRPIWIFKGNSGLGKSFIANHLEGLKVLETDSCEYLQDEITEDIIVLGNKYPYTIEEIDNRIFGEHEIHIVEFK